MTTENKIKYFENREDWRKWLMDNFETSCEIWFVFPYSHQVKKAFYTMMLLKKPFASIGLTAQQDHLTKIIKFSVSHPEILKVLTHKPTKKDLNGYWKIK